MPWNREQMAQRAAEEISDGQIVNLGIGIPTLVANYLTGKRVFLHSENGLLGMGPFPLEHEVDPQIINAGKQTVTILPGGSTFDSATSFAMIRGGHLDLAILGAMQVSENGDLANWAVPGQKIAGMGGAMDLCNGTPRLICLLQHTDKDGASKLVKTCNLPLTGLKCVHRIVTDLGVFDIAPEGGFRLVELAPGVELAQVKACTQGKLLH
jgi:3-oxoacid CoA-transferase subunit B